MHNHKPFSSKAKTRAAICAACAIWLGVLIPAIPTAGGEIRVESGEDTDTIISVNPAMPSAHPGSVVIESGEGEDTVMEANPPVPAEDSPQPLIITPEIRVREQEPWSRQRSSGKP